MNTTTNTPGVSEAMVMRGLAAWRETSPSSSGIPEVTAILEAALSAPEPAAQGDAEALELLAAEYERWGSSVIAKALRANGVGNNAFDYEVAIRAVKRALAPPAQPAERVPEAVVVPYGSESGEKDYAYGYEKGRADGWNACRDAMLTSSPAPSEGVPEGVEFCSVCRKPFGPTETRVGTGDGTMRANNGRGSFAHRHCYEAAAQQAAR